MKRVVVVVVALVVLAAWVTSWGAASGPDRVTRLERKVTDQGKTIRLLQSEILALQMHDTYAAEALDSVRVRVEAVETKVCGGPC